MSWLPITCAESDALHRERDLYIEVGFTDMDGEHGEPQVLREWADKATSDLVVRDLWYPRTEACEHYRFHHNDCDDPTLAKAVDE